MRALLLYPRYPKTFWSYDQILALVKRRALMPPLALVTVAALLPKEWELKLIDCNVRDVTADEWDWADVVMLTAMIVQRRDFRALVNEAKRRGKPVVVGGPYATSLPNEAAAAGADYLVLDEGELTIPPFLEALERDARAGWPVQDAQVFRAGDAKPDVTTSPVPRFELLDLDAYDTMAVQFSRGCPFLCEFCDIITLYGRRPRTKTPAQMLRELDALYRLGWRRSVFLVDDNFIGNKRAVKALLAELHTWQRQHDYPFGFETEASVDLAADADLLTAMVACNFDAVFIGIETPDEDSLRLVRKHQNTRRALIDSVETLTRSGLRVMAGFIVGFDNEQPGAGRRIIRFIEDTAIPTALISLMQALPNTALWQRLEREGRLRADGDGNQTTLMNFLPTRPVNEVAAEYVQAFTDAYEPTRYLDRTYRYFLRLGPPVQARRNTRVSGWRGLLRWTRDRVREVRALAIVCWRQGVRRATRRRFWHHLIAIAVRKPHLLPQYVTVCAHNEHFLEYRSLVSTEITAQAEVFLAREAQRPQPSIAPRQPSGALSDASAWAESAS